ncbi:Arc family DNA-binding protein [Rhizobium ruizarguesonis]
MTKKPIQPKIGSIAPFGLRMMPDLREKLEGAAFRNGRSMNAEIVSRLSESLEMDEAMDEGINDPDAAFASMKPVLELVSKEIAQRYEDRLASMEKAIGDISELIKGGQLTADDASRLDASIKKVRRRRQKSDNED